MPLHCKGVLSPVKCRKISFLYHRIKEIKNKRSTERKIGLTVAQTTNTYQGTPKKHSSWTSSDY